jgi:hypothetical protein
LAHPSGEQPSVEVYSATADTFAGRVHVEWDSTFITPKRDLQPLRSWRFAWLQPNLSTGGQSTLEAVTS